MSGVMSRHGELHLFPPGFELISAEVGQDVVIDVDAGRFGLLGEGKHLGTRRRVADDIESHKSDAMGGEPVDGFVAPWAARFDEKSDLHGVGESFGVVGHLSDAVNRWACQPDKCA